MANRHHLSFVASYPSVLAQPALARVAGVAGVLLGLWVAVLWAVSIA